MLNFNAVKLHGGRSSDVIATKILGFGRVFISVTCSKAMLSEYISSNLTHEIFGLRTSPYHQIEKCEHRK